ncbi:MAG: DUF3169 family protein [Eubacteriales bacterium]|nr:DUF3169 family protein [Eubacteriales bacterium]
MKKINSERKILFQFIALLMVSGLIGGLIGIFFTDHEKWVVHFASGFQQVMADLAPYLMSVIGSAGLISSFLIYKTSQKRASEWDQEDEDYIEQVECQIERGIIITEMIQILIFLFLGFLFLNLKEEQNVAAGMIGCLIFLILSVASMVLQRAYIHLMQKINPEKRGDAFEFKFQKKWIDSCDELERMEIYESSYYSFQALQKCFPVAVGILLFAEVYFEAGILPIIVVCLLWMIQTVAYKRHAMKLRRKGK